VVVRPTRHLTRFLVWFDGKGVDGFVTGVADRLGDTSQFLRKPQTGYVRSYALTMFGGVAVLVLALLAVTLA
jgi:NADH-quinone oxidoreductase subunit L